MNISGYIPSRLRTEVAFPERSFEEMAWGPNLLMGREKEQKKEVDDLGNAILDWQYFDQDDARVKPKIEALQGKIDTLSSKMATQGYNPMMANEISSLKREYQKELGPHGDIGRAVGNYKDAMAQWKEWDTAHKDDPQEFRQRAKKYFFDQYKGMVDEDGQYRGFEAGSLPNYYDVNKDIRDALKDATGKIGEVVGSEGSSIKIDTSSGVPMLKVFNSNTGQYMDNLQPLLSGAQAVLDDYSGAYGTNTDRARFAKVQGVTPEYLTNTVSNIMQSRRESSFDKLPSSSGSYQNIPKEDVDSGTSKFKSTGSIIAPQGGSLIPRDIESLEADPYKDVANDLAIKEAKKLGLNITSYDELKEKGKEVESRAIKRGHKVAQQTPEAEKASKALKAIENTIKTMGDPVLPTFNINRLASASGKDVNEINTLKKAFGETIQEERDKFLGVNKDHQKAFESITKDMKIKGFAMNPKRDKAGLVLELEGLNDKDKTVNTTVYLNPAQNDLENVIYNYLGQMDFDIYRQYMRQKTGQILDREGNIVGVE